MSKATQLLLQLSNSTITLHNNRLELKFNSKGEAFSAFLNLANEAAALRSAQHDLASDEHREELKGEVH